MIFVYLSGMQNLYSFLKLSENSSQEEIIDAFNTFKKELARFSPGIEIKDEELRSRKPKVWDAFQILIDPVKRKEQS